MSQTLLSITFFTHSDQVHRNFEEIYELLSSKKIKGVLIDGYVVGSNKHLFEKPFLRIYKIYDYSSIYGLVTGGDSRKLLKCFRSYMQENIAKIFQHVADNVEAIEVTLDLTSNPQYQNTNSPLLSPYIYYSSSGEKLLNFSRLHLG